MPTQTKGARLWLRPARSDKRGAAVFLIRDGKHEESTRCGPDDRRGAERALGQYLARKHVTAVTAGRRHPAQIPVADIIGLYAQDVAPGHARPHETARRLAALLRFFGSKTLSEVNGARCREYAAQRTTQTMARKELEDLRAAINHHRREGLCSEIVEIVLPPAPTARERWLTRDEAAALIWAAWRHRERQLGSETERHTRRHVARFALVALYTGTRATAICNASLYPSSETGWIDIERGVFYRRAVGSRETKKRTPPIPLPPHLLAHMRRWKAAGQRYVVEWNGAPIARMAKAFRATVADAGLEGRVTPHSLRHTAATWLMQAGTDLWEAAGYLGMTTEMLSARYGHHHPNHLSGARDAFRRHRLMGKVAA